MGLVTIIEVLRTSSGRLSIEINYLKIPSLEGTNFGNQTRFIHGTTQKGLNEPHNKVSIAHNTIINPSMRNE